MASVGYVNLSTKVTSGLQAVLGTDEIVPGAAPSYEACKLIYSFHPLGKKLTDKPIEMAQSQKRVITVEDSPEDDVRKQFEKQWIADGCDDAAFKCASLSRVYGIATLALKTLNKANSAPVDFQNLWKEKITFSVFDPLNTAGSLVLNQDPNAFDFLKPTDVSVNGEVYHRSRCAVLINEQPIYIEYTPAAFGFVGRSVYQRILYPLKSFIGTMVTDDMVSRKGGLLIAKMEEVGPIVNNLMLKIFGMKRNLLKEAETNNVLSIGTKEDVQSLDLTNIEAATTAARRNIIENIALGSSTPAKIINDESFAEGFGEGAEDSKVIAAFVDSVRIQMASIYAFLDQVTMMRAWSPDFYATMQQKYPEEYGKVDYKTALYRWINTFEAVWPNYLRESDADLAILEEKKFDALLGAAGVLLPILDPENKSAVIQWVVDNLNENKILFPNALSLDMEAFESFKPEVKAPPGEVETDEEAKERVDSAIINYRQRVAARAARMQELRGPDPVTKLMRAT